MFLLQPCQQKHSWAFSAPEGAGLVLPVQALAGGYMWLPGGSHVGEGTWLLDQLGALRLAAGVDEVTQAILALVDTVSSVSRGQRWMCSAHCECLRRSFCTC